MSALGSYSYNAGLSGSVDRGLSITSDESNLSYRSPLDTRSGISSRSPAARSTLSDPIATQSTTTSTVSTAPVTPSDRWTVMIYIASDNLEGYAIQDFLELAAVGSSNEVNILVQFDRADASSFSSSAADVTSYGNWTDTRRGIVQAGDTPTQNWGTSIGEVNTGDSTTLSNFLNWGMTNYQAENYGLVLWGHGNGMGVSMDETGDLLTGREVSSALAGLPNNLALVAADSCLMGTVEFAYDLSRDASIFVGSQELVSSYGFEYTSIFANLTANPTWNAVQFGNTIASSYQSYYSQVNTSFAETLSVIDLSKVGGLVSAIDQFANTIMTNSTDYDRYVLDYFRDYYANKFGDGDYPSYVDIGNVFARFVNYATVVNPAFITDAVADAAQSVLTAYNNLVLINVSAEPGRATGLSIYFSNRGYNPTSSYNSTNLSFTSDTRWDDFLRWSGW